MTVQVHAGVHAMSGTSRHADVLGLAVTQEADSWLPSCASTFLVDGVVWDLGRVVTAKF